LRQIDLLQPGKCCTLNKFPDNKFSKAASGRAGLIDHPVG
jgi:hypothetical protein